MPVSYKQLLTGANGSDDELNESFAILQELIGELLWKRMYNGKDVTTGMLVPFQIGTILLDSLRKADDMMKTYSKLVDYSQEAAVTFQRFQEEDAKQQQGQTGYYAPY